MFGKIFRVSLALLSPAALAVGTENPVPAAANQDPANPAPTQAVKPATLAEVRTKVIQGEFAEAAALSDEVTSNYEQARDASPPGQRAWILESCMADYCLFAKAQILALKGDAKAAANAFNAAEDYHSQHAETQAPSMTRVWKELEVVTQGLIFESKGDLAGAVQEYVNLPDSVRCSSRLAVLCYKRGQFDQAREWALPHADNPTCQYVLAELALRSKNIGAARQHVDRARQLIAQAQNASKEVMPAFYCESAHIAIFRSKLPRPPPISALPGPPSPAAGAAPPQDSAR